MPLDLYANAKRELNDYVATQPAYGPAPDFGQTFLASIQANAGSLAVLRAADNSQQLVHDWLDAFEAKTGQQIDPFVDAFPGDFNYDTLNKAYLTAKSSRPTFDLTPPPTREQAWQHAMDIERDIAGTSAALSDPSRHVQTLGSQFANSAGAMAAFAVDPITILSSGAMSPEASGLFFGALREGAVFAGQQAAISISKYPVSKGLNPDYGPLDVLNEAATAGITGAGLGLGIRGLAKVVGMAAERGLPRYAQDAGNVVQRDAADQATRPPATDPAAVTVHEQNVRAAQQAVIDGKPVTADMLTTDPLRPKPAVEVVGEIQGYFGGVDRDLSPQAQAIIDRMPANLKDAAFKEIGFQQGLREAAGFDAGGGGGGDAVGFLEEAEIEAARKGHVIDDAYRKANEFIAREADRSAAAARDAGGVTTLYRGVRNDLAATDKGVFFTDVRKNAETYAKMVNVASDGAVLERRARFQNLLEAKNLGDAYKQLGVRQPARDLKVSDGLLEAARARGYDGIKYEGVVGREYIVLDQAVFDPVAKDAAVPQAGDVQAALAKAGREDLAPAAEAALQPEAVAKSLADPVTDDAAVHDVEHLLEDAPNLAVADPAGMLNPDGSPVMRSVRELLDEADAEIAMARDIEACAAGALPMEEAAATA